MRQKEHLISETSGRPGATEDVMSEEVPRPSGRGRSEGRQTLLGVPNSLCKFGRMAKLAHALALGASGETLGGSNPLPPTKA